MMVVPIVSVPWVGGGGHVWVGDPLKIRVVSIRGRVVDGKVVSQMWCTRWS